MAGTRTQPSRSARAMTLEEWDELPEEVEGVKYGLAVGLGRKPDYSVFFAGHLPPAEGLVRIPPDIAIEIVSRTVEIFALGDDRRYASVFSATGGVHGEIAGCPGLSLDIDELWRQVDRVARPS